jgi:C-terminal processing protease CtpA/Prc
LEPLINKFSIFIIFVYTFTTYNVNSNEVNPTYISPQEYISEILALMKLHVSTKNQINWDDLNHRVKDLSKNAKNIEDTYPSIKLALKLLKTNHSSLRDKNGKLVAYHSNLKCGETIDDYIPSLSNIGYIRVNGFSSSSPLENKKFALTLQSKISEQDSQNLLGWIVDLRWNSGGNMWPMIAGIGPLLGNGTYGYFINKNEMSWGYRDGSSVVNGNPIVSISEPYELFSSNPKIAVLSSQNTASSGEATLISFKERVNVKSFGTNTCGLSTANSPFALSDGSQLNLTISTMANKSKTLYGGAVTVDELVPQNKVIDAAVHWLNSQQQLTRK